MSRSSRIAPPGSEPMYRIGKEQIAHVNHLALEETVQAMQKADAMVQQFKGFGQRADKTRKRHDN